METSYFLMDTQGLKLLLTTTSLEAAFYHADLLLPAKDYLVNEWKYDAFRTFANWELERIYKNTTGKDCPPYNNRTTLVGLVLILRSTMVNTDTVEALHKRLRRSPTQPEPYGRQTLPAPSQEAPVMVASWLLPKGQQQPAPPPLTPVWLQK